MDESIIAEDINEIFPKNGIENAKNITQNTEEMQYLNQIREIMDKGTERSDRTGTGTISIFGMQSRYSLRNNTIPVLTTKKVFWRAIVEELIWFINGYTDSKILSKKGVKIWDVNGSRKFLDGLGFTEREEGDLGPVYGFQWRHFGAKYKSCNTDYADEGVDQLSQVIDMIKKTPDSRRIILCAWNPADLSLMAIPPCHTLVQFYVNANPRDGGTPELSSQLYQRSGDMGLGVPFNIASYSLLTHMIAKVTGLRAGDFVHTLGDAHVYKDHIDPLKEQLCRHPYSFPKLKLSDVDSIDKFKAEDVELLNYIHHPPIKMSMSA